MERSQVSELPIGHTRKKHLQNIIEVKRKPMLRLDYSAQDVWARRIVWWKSTAKVLAAKAAEALQN
jgi:hypothetical protein